MYGRGYGARTGYLESLAAARTITIEGTKLTMETGAGTLIFSEVGN